MTAFLNEKIGTRKKNEIITSRLSRQQDKNLGFILINLEKL